MVEHDGKEDPAEVAPRGLAEATRQSTSTTPPPGTPKRIYFFAAAPGGKVDASGVAQHVADLGEILHRSKERPADPGPASEDG